MKASPKYEAAAGCADVRTRQQDFCAEVKAKEAEIKAAKRDMDAGRPASVDPQAETLASLTGLEFEQSRQPSPSRSPSSWSWSVRSASLRSPTPRRRLALRLALPHWKPRFTPARF